MTQNKRARWTHRWLSIVFTATVIICFVALTGSLPSWVFYLPLLPLALLMATGLYLFALPYTARWRNGRRAPLET
jgi:ABC-type Mn2+/Zn2+ transport system permease subunit